MPNANENMAPVVQTDAATEPIDLAQAFKMLNQANREAAQNMVEDGEGVRDSQGGTDSQEPSDTNAVGIQDDQSEVTASDISDTGEHSDDGGSADGIEAIDFNAYKQDMLRNIQRNATSQIRKEFEEQNIGYYSAAELTVRDEQTGQVRFRNPDVQDERDPNYYFKSRSEMQQFVDAWNKGVDFEFRKAVNEKQRELMNQEAPRAALIDFIPRFQAMNPATQGIFDALLEGHEVRDANGKTVGFNVNLNAVAAQAEKIAKSIGGNQVAQQPVEQDTGKNQVSNYSEPAMDAKTGNGKATDEKEPTNIGEALKMFDKKNRGGK